MKITKEKREQVYAYGTKVTVSGSLEEIKRILYKHGCSWIGEITNPHNSKEKFISFMLNTKEGMIPIRIDVPQIWYKTRYLEKESYRGLVLLVKSKLTQVEFGEPLTLVFLPNMNSEHRQLFLPPPKENVLLPELNGK